MAVHLGLAMTSVEVLVASEEPRDPELSPELVDDVQDLADADLAGHHQGGALLLRVVPGPQTVHDALFFHWFDGIEFLI